MGIRPHRLDTDRLANQDHSYPSVHPLPLDDQDLADKRANVHDFTDLSVLPWQGIFADAPQCSFQVGHNLLAARRGTLLEGYNQL